MELFLSGDHPITITVAEDGVILEVYDPENDVEIDTLCSFDEFDTIVAFVNQQRSLGTSIEDDEERYY